MSTVRLRVENKKLLQTYQCTIPDLCYVYYQGKLHNANHYSVAMPIYPALLQFIEHRLTPASSPLKNEGILKSKITAQCALLPREEKQIIQSVFQLLSDDRKRFIQFCEEARSDEQGTPQEEKWEEDDDRNDLLAWLEARYQKDCQKQLADHQFHESTERSKALAPKAVRKRGRIEDTQRVIDNAIKAHTQNNSEALLSLEKILHQLAEESQIHRMPSEAPAAQPAPLPVAANTPEVNRRQDKPCNYAVCRFFSTVYVAVRDWYKTKNAGEENSQPAMRHSPSNH
jgi:hypothetical protein